MKKTVVSAQDKNIFLPEKIEKAVFLLHGYGSNGADMFDLVPQLAESLPNTAFFCPDAGEELPREIQPKHYTENQEMYQWFPLLDELQIVSMGSIEDFQDFADGLLQKASIASADFAEYAQQVKAEYNLADSDIAFAGFSQGAEVAIGASFSASSPIAAVVGFSPMTSYFYSGEIISRPPLLLIHGDKDEVIPYALYQMTLDLLQQNNVEYEDFVMKDCGHFINDEAIDVAISFLKKNLFKQ